MKFLRHLFEQPFIAATGFAALIHSTWALGTFFAGIEPERWTIDWWGWLLPALLIAFSLDVGQISTSMKIRESGLKLGNVLAFLVIALFTYFLQFLHLAHHMPDLPLAAGISESHRYAALWLRDFAIWLIPALLPLSTLLYTFSTDDNKEQPIAPTHPEPTILVGKQEQPLIEEKVTEIESSIILTEERIQEPKYLAECEDCGWCKQYDDSAKASRALRTHKHLHCSKREELVKISANGHME